MQRGSERISRRGIRVKKSAIDELRHRLDELKSGEDLEKIAAGQVEERLANGILRSVMEYLPEGMLVADVPDLRIRMISRYGQKLIGLPFEELTDKTLQETMQSWRMLREDGSSLENIEEHPLVRAVRDGLLVTEEEWILERESGERIPIVCNAGPILDEKGAITGGILSWIDVAELKLYEQKLEESEERFRKTFGSSPSLLVLSTFPEGRIVEANDAFMEMTGYSKTEALGRTSLEVGISLAPGEQERLRAVLEKDGRFANQEVRIRTRSGEIKIALVSAEVVEIGGERYAISGALDITDRQRAQKKLRRKEQEIRSLVESASDIIARFDRDFSYLYINPAIERIIGIPSKAFAGKALGQVYLSEEAFRIMENGLKQAFDAGEELSVEWEYDSLEGRKFFQTRLTPERFGEDDAVTSVLAVSRDITDLRQAREAAEKATRAKSEFLANMSHEIRTPMNGILGMIHLALTTCKEPAAREYLDLAQQSGRHLLGIVGDILDLSKIEAERFELESAPFDPQAMLRTLLGTMRLEAERKGIGFEAVVDKNVPDRLVGDEGRLRQVFVNLIGNAIKFTAEGEVAVHVAATAPSEQMKADSPCASRERVCLVASISDTGIGIPPDKLERVFDTFSQTSVGAKYGGTGLGLSISKRLVELMHGSIWAESTQGRGSTFTFIVQLDPADAAQAVALQPQPEPERAGLPSLKILLAEDNPINKLLAEELLKRRGHSVTSVETGGAAIDALRKEHFDLVLMDARMPEMDGEEATRVIRKYTPPGVDRDVPIVALTAYAQRGDRERFLAAGMNDYLSKPIDMEELDRVLRRVLERDREGG